MSCSFMTLETSGSFYFHIYLIYSIFFLLRGWMWYYAWLWINVYLFERMYINGGNMDKRWPYI